MRVVSYLRVSSRGQIDGDGPERQRETIEKFAKAHDLEIVQEFFERGVSGTTESLDRPAFADLVTMVSRRQNIDAIVVERIDRLARDLMVSELLLAECRKAGLKVFAADRGELVDIASNDCDPSQKLIRQVIAAIAEFEKSVLVRRLAIGRARKEARTGKPVGEKPFGYYPQEAETINYVAALAMQDPRPSYRDIARAASEAGFRSRSGGVLNPGTIFRILEARKES